MKRRALRIFLFLLLGAIVNVAVAWTCSLFVDYTKVEEPLIGLVMTDSESWEVARLDRFGVTWVDTTHGRRSFSKPHHVEHPPSELAPAWGGVADRPPEFLAVDLAAQDGLALRHLGVIGCGWPARSLWCQAYSAVGGKRSTVRTGLRGAIDVGIEGWRCSNMWPRVLPLRPIWPGFAINTLFYAGILWLMFAAPFALRRRRRIKRGLCPGCAYPVGLSDICTECGRPVTVKSPTTESDIAQQV